MKTKVNFAVARPGIGPGTPRIHTEQTDKFTLFKFFDDIASRNYNMKGWSSYLVENEELKKTIPNLIKTDILVVGVEHVWDRYAFGYLLSPLVQSHASKANVMSNTVEEK